MIFLFSYDSKDTRSCLRWLTTKNLCRKDSCGCCQLRSVTSGLRAHRFARPLYGLEDITAVQDEELWELQRTRHTHWSILTFRVRNEEEIKARLSLEESHPTCNSFIDFTHSLSAKWRFHISQVYRSTRLEFSLRYFLFDRYRCSVWLQLMRLLNFVHYTKDVIMFGPIASLDCKSCNKALSSPPLLFLHLIMCTWPLCCVFEEESRAGCFLAASCDLSAVRRAHCRGKSVPFYALQSLSLCQGSTYAFLFSGMSALPFAHRFSLIRMCSRFHLLFPWNDAEVSCGASQAKLVFTLLWSTSHPSSKCRHKRRIIYLKIPIVVVNFINKRKQAIVEGSIVSITSCHVRRKANDDDTVCINGKGWNGSDGIACKEKLPKLHNTYLSS